MSDVDVSELLSELKKIERYLGKARAKIEALAGSQAPQKRSVRPKLDYRSVDGLCQKSWRTWLEYRKERGDAPYKTTRVARWLATFNPIEQERIVAQSINREWAGLFEVKQGHGTPKREPREVSFL